MRAESAVSGLPIGRTLTIAPYRDGKAELTAAIREGIEARFAGSDGVRDVERPPTA
jgi:hypothetical protein